MGSIGGAMNVISFTSSQTCYYENQNKSIDSFSLYDYYFSVYNVSTSIFL